jgi:hypothetical protein
MALASHPIHRPVVIMSSYWTPPATDDLCEGVVIRHTSHAEAAYISTCQAQGRNGVMPSACVWMVPATNPEDPDYERAPSLERHARISASAYWLGQVPREC